METPITLAVGERRLFGMLHEPVARATSFGVVFLNAGPQNRVGPQRIYVHAARRFAAAGLTCLRIDLPGVGESEGAFPENSLDCHDPASVRGAVDALRERALRGIAVLGICAGARVAVRAALGDSRIDSVVAWSAPIVSGAPDILEANISKAAATEQLRHWRKRLRQPGRWGRYFRSRDARREGFVKLRSVLTTTFDRSDVPPVPEFVHEMRALLDSLRPTFIAYGERDVVPLVEFTEHLAPSVERPDRDRCVLIVPGGDHTYSAIAARDHVIDETLRWLLQRSRAS